MSLEFNNNDTCNLKEEQEEEEGQNASPSYNTKYQDCKGGEAFDSEQHQHIPIIIESPFTLTAEEHLLFSALLAAAEYHYSKQSNNNNITIQEEGGGGAPSRLLNIRVAGGWVRDKMLNLTSDDIDVTLDHVSGVQFAHMVRDYLEQYDHHDDHPHKYKIGVIAANPHQSKHLETATMKLFGFHVDFCHLRAEETYHSHSRIPSIREAFGTPYEDAMRRDFTINSLFYNIRSHTVEDYTRRGIHDLIAEPAIVTPLDAHETFHDDPLRVLRAIRFAVRFQYPIHDSMRQAATSREVHDSLMRKVSRERVGTELEGMLTGKAANPRMALTMIGELGLSDAVFLVSTPGKDSEDASKGNISICGSIVYHCHGATSANSRDTEDMDATTDDLSSNMYDTRSSFTITGPSPQPPLAYQHQTTSEEREILRSHGWSESLQLLKLVDNFLIPYKESWVTTYGVNNTNATPLDERIFLLALYLSPFRDLTWQDHVKLKRNRVITISMLKDGVKFPNRDVDAVECIMEHLDLFLKELRRETTAMITPLTNYHHGQTFSRLEVGLLLRNLKQRWVTCLLLAGCIELRMASFNNRCDINSSSWRNVVQACENFYRFVHEQNLDACWEMRPLLNGKEIMQQLKMIGGGRIIGQLVDEQWKWMLQNPLGGKDECVTFLEQKYRELINK